MLLLDLEQKSALICRLDQNLKAGKSADFVVTDNLFTCLGKAAGGQFELIVISFSTRQISARKPIIDFCTCIRSNPLTSDTPLFAVMTSWHRVMAVKLQRAGVDFLKIRNPEIPLDLDSLIRHVREGDVSHRVERVLSRLCPYLNYSPIDAQRELITCQAYRNRMVLGGKRLHELCESEGHLFCHYFLNPKIKP